MEEPQATGANTKGRRRSARIAAVAAKAKMGMKRSRVDGHHDQEDLYLQTQGDRRRKKVRVHNEEMPAIVPPFPPVELGYIDAAGFDTRWYLPESRSQLSFQSKQGPASVAMRSVAATLSTAPEPVPQPPVRRLSSSIGTSLPVFDPLNRPGHERYSYFGHSSEADSDPGHKNLAGGTSEPARAEELRGMMENNNAFKDFFPEGSHDADRSALAQWVISDEEMLFARNAPEAFHDYIQGLMGEGKDKHMDDLPLVLDEAQMP